MDNACDLFIHELRDILNAESRVSSRLGASALSLKWVRRFPAQAEKQIPPPPIHSASE